MRVCGRFIFQKPAYFYSFSPLVAFHIPTHLSVPVVPADRCRTPLAAGIQRLDERVQKWQSGRDGQVIVAKEKRLSTSQPSGRKNPSQRDQSDSIRRGAMPQIVHWGQQHPGTEPGWWLHIIEPIQYQPAWRGLVKRDPTRITSLQGFARHHQPRLGPISQQDGIRIQGITSAHAPVHGVAVHVIALCHIHKLVFIFHEAVICALYLIHPTGAPALACTLGLLHRIGLRLVITHMCRPSAKYQSVAKEGSPHIRFFHVLTLLKRPNRLGLGLQRLTKAAKKAFFRLDVRGGVLKNTLKIVGHSSINRHARSPSTVHKLSKTVVTDDGLGSLAAVQGRTDRADRHQTISAPAALAGNARLAASFSCRSQWLPEGVAGRVSTENQHDTRNRNKLRA